MSVGVVVGSCGNKIDWDDFFENKQSLRQFVDEAVPAMQAIVD